MSESVGSPRNKSRIASLLDPSFCDKLLRSEGTTHFLPSPRNIAALILSAAPILILLATLIDGTVEMTSGAKGLSQHLGFWVIFATTPVLLLLTSYLVRSFEKLAAAPQDFLIEDIPPNELAKLTRVIAYELSSLHLRTRSRFVLLLGMIAGLQYFVLNIVKTYEPVSTYGHDVFDSWAHAWGCWTTKAYLFPVFVLVYPVAIFVSIHVTWSLSRIMRLLQAKNLLQIRLFHEDNCGGMSRFGYLNVLIMLVYAILLSVVLGMFLTHARTYFVMQSALVFCSLVLALQSVLGVLAIARFVRQRKREYLRLLGEQMDRRIRSTVELGQPFSADLLALRSHISQIHSFPYVGRVKVVVEIIRFAPAAIALVTHL